MDFSRNDAVGQASRLSLTLTRIPKRPAESSGDASHFSRQRHNRRRNWRRGRRLHLSATRRRSYAQANFGSRVQLLVPDVSSRLARFDAGVDAGSVRFADCGCAA